MSGEAEKEKDESMASNEICLIKQKSMTNRLLRAGNSMVQGSAVHTISCYLSWYDSTELMRLCRSLPSQPHLQTSINDPCDSIYTSEIHGSEIQIAYIKGDNHMQRMCQ